MHGWYRAYRALAGSIKYNANWKGWSPFEHKIFPRPVRDAVVTLLMCQNRDRAGLPMLRNHNNSTKSIVNADFHNTRSHTSIIATSCKASAKDEQSTSVEFYNAKLSATAKVINGVSTLPVFVIYNILEFMVRSCGGSCYLSQYYYYECSSC